MGNVRGNPVLIESRTHQGKRLERVPLFEKLIDEGWLQEMIRRHPQLLPVADIEPALGRLIPIGREVGTRSGSIDNLYITTSGVLIIAECKLWRNHQQSREVLAQVLDYARAARDWRYGDVEKIALDYFRRYKVAATSLYGRLKEDGGELLSEAEYSDAVDRLLADGNMLLLVVGDGIREGLRELAQMVGGSPDMRYRVALIQVALYRMGHGEWPIVAVPTIVAETVELTRGVIQIKYEAEYRPTVTTTEVDNAVTATKAKRITISEELFLKEVDKQTATSKISAKSAQAVKLCLSVLKEEFEAEWVMGTTVSSLLARHEQATCFALYTKGHLYPHFLSLLTKKAGKEKAVAMQKRFEEIFGRPVHRRLGEARSQAYDCTAVTDPKKMAAFVSLVKDFKAEWPQLALKRK